MNKLIRKFQTPFDGINYWAEQQPDYADYANHLRQVYEETKAQQPQPVQTRAPQISASDQKRIDRDTYTAKQNALAKLGLYKLAVDGRWGRGSHAAEKEALAQGYNWNGSDYVKPQPKEPAGGKYITPEEDVARSGYHLLTNYPRNLMNNMYPYSYGEDEDGKSTSTASGDIELQTAAFKRKVEGAMQGKDPRRQLMEDLADNEIGSEVWNNYLKGEALENFRHPYWKAHPEELQFALRGRLDQMSLAENRGQKYGTYEVNPNYSSKSAGDLPTYRIADPKRRAAEYASALAYMRANKDKAVRSKDGKSYIWSVIGDPYAQHGNYSLVADDLENLTNARFVDNWDYVLNPAGNVPVWVGDYLAEGANGQVIPARRMREAITETDMTPSDMAKVGARMVASDLYNQAKSAVKSWLPFGRQGLKLIPRRRY